jgi:plasmid stability protein
MAGRIAAFGPHLSAACPHSWGHIGPVDAARQGACHYDGTVDKATFRIPEPLLDELRQMARAEGRSLNATALDVLRRGLGKPSPIDAEMREALGSMVAQPAVRTFDAIAFREQVRRLEVPRRDPDQDLAWAREDR